MTHLLLAILNEYTALELDKDLFYLEMPLSASGLWVQDRQTERLRTGVKEWNVYYRSKKKTTAIKNIEYLTDTIDGLEECSIDGEIFKLKVLYEWDFVGKSSEGYFIFGNTLSLV